MARLRFVVVVGTEAWRPGWGWRALLVGVGVVLSLPLGDRSGARDASRERDNC